MMPHIAFGVSFIESDEIPSWRTAALASAALLAMPLNMNARLPTSAHCCSTAPALAVWSSQQHSRTQQVRHGECIGVL